MVDHGMSFVLQEEVLGLWGGYSIHHGGQG
jgi:hypothetical protein